MSSTQPSARGSDASLPTTTPCDGTGGAPAISYRDLVEALEKLVLQVSELSHQQRTTTGATAEANESTSCTAKDDSKLASSYTTYSYDTTSGRHGYDSESPNASEETLSPLDNLVDTCKGVRAENLPTLVEFGVQDLVPTPETPVVGEERCRVEDTPGHAEVTTTAPQKYSYSVANPHFEELYPTYATYEGFNTQTDVYNWDPDPFACTIYSPAQLTFFGDFLRSPFAPSAQPAADAIGINPFDTEPHPPRCDCERCFLMEVALNKDPKVLSPLEPWVAAGQPGEE